LIDGRLPRRLVGSLFRRQDAALSRLPSGPKSR
jgi:hypothetical protein